MELNKNRTVLDLERYVPGLVVFLSNRLASGASSTYRRLFGIGVTEWRVISMLAVEPNITAQRICQVIGLDKAIVSRTIHALESQAYIKMQPDQHHGRRITLALTVKGWRLHDEVFVVAKERERILLDGLTEVEKDKLIRLLQNLLARVNAVNAFSPNAAGRRAPRVRKT